MPEELRALCSARFPPDDEVLLVDGVLGDERVIGN